MNKWPERYNDSPGSIPLQGEIYIDTSVLEDLTKLDGILHWKTISLMIVRAMNHTGAKVKSAIITEIYRRWNLKRSEIASRIHDKKANFRNFTYTIYSRHDKAAISFRHFSAKQAYTGRGSKKVRSGVKVKLHREFKGRTKTGKSRFIAGWTYYQKGFMLPVFGTQIAYIRKGPGRRDIVPMTGPSVAQILENRDIQQTARKIWARDLSKRLEHEIENILIRGAIGDGLRFED